MVEIVEALERIQRCQWKTVQRKVQCGQPEGHQGSHGNGLLTTPRDEWYLPEPELIKDMQS